MTALPRDLLARLGDRDLRDLLAQLAAGLGVELARAGAPVAVSLRFLAIRCGVTTASLEAALRAMGTQPAVVSGQMEQVALVAARQGTEATTTAATAAAAWADVKTGEGSKSPSPTARARAWRLLDGAGYAPGMAERVVTAWMEEVG